MILLTSFYTFVSDVVVAPYRHDQSGCAGFHRNSDSSANNADEQQYSISTLDVRRDFQNHIWLLLCKDYQSVYNTLFGSRLELRIFIYDR